MRNTGHVLNVLQRLFSLVCVCFAFHLSLESSLWLCAALMLFEGTLKEVQYKAPDQPQYDNNDVVMCKMPDFVFLNEKEYMDMESKSAESHCFTDSCDSRQRCLPFYPEHRDKNREILSKAGWLVFGSGKAYCPSCRKERFKSAHGSLCKNLSRPVYQFHQFEEPKVFDNE